MHEALTQLDDDARGKLRKRKPPTWVSPMLARLHDEAFSDAGWIYERKLDGERCLAFRDGRRVRLMSRNRKSLNDTYPEVVEALGRQASKSFVIDGEVVAFSGGATSFARLQQRMQIDDADEARRSGVAVFYYVFDLLYLGDHDTTQLAQRDRKNVLRRAIDFARPLRLTAHQNGDGEQYYRQACRKGWEGLIAKDASAHYAHGRSSKWLKLKCANEQEFVIAGYTEPKGSRVGFGALLIGYYDGGDLRYAGKVGTGYDDETLRSLHRRLQKLETDAPHLADEKLPHKGVHWVRPKLVGQFAYTELTRERRLRHPRFLGLRRDKSPEDVHLESEG